MLANLVPIHRALPAEGIALSLYPDTSKPGNWVVVLERQGQEQRYIIVPEGLVPKGIPVSGAKLVASKDDNDDWTLVYGHLPDPYAATIARTTVPGKASLKRTIEELLSASVQELIPSLMKLIS